MFRTKIISLIVIFMFLLLLFGLANLQILQYRNLSKLSDKNCIRLIPQIGARGKIIDTQGNIIIDNKLSYNVMILPEDTKALEQVLLKVSQILRVSPNELKKVYKGGYVAPSVPIVIARNIDIDKAIALEELKVSLPGVVIQQEPLRDYPYKSLGAHVIGYLNEIDRWRLTKLEDYGYKTKDIVGFGGVEEKYDYYLRQEEGGLSMEVDSHGRLVRVLGFRPPRNGRDIQLTLNLKIQNIAEQKLAGRKGSVIIMDPYSGAVIAMVSSPSFNPAVFVNKSASSISNLFSDRDAPLINRAISARYPPGSVFKVIVATAALETGKIDLSTSFLCEGSILVGNQEFKCWEAHGWQNLLAAIAHSCNVFFYKTGLLCGAQTIHDYALKFGLSRSTSFELPYEVGGFIPSPLWRKINKFQNWFDGDTVNMSIGQGDVLVTPLQITRMMAVFANKGYLVTPYIVKAIDGRDVSRYHKRITRCPIKASTLDYIRDGLRGAVSDPGGTANLLSALPVSVAGKTGTAQAPPGQPHAWFTGFFPYKNPKFVICVLLERGRSGHYSCLIAKQIIERLIAEGLM